MFPFVRIQEGLPVLTPPPIASQFFDVDIGRVVVLLRESHVRVGAEYKMQNNTPQDLEEFEYELTFSFVAEGQAVKIADVKEKIKKWVAGSWTKDLTTPLIDIQFPAGKVLYDNVRNRGTIEFVIDGVFVYLIPMWFSKTKDLKGNGVGTFK